MSENDIKVKKRVTLLKISENKYETHTRPTAETHTHTKNYETKNNSEHVTTGGVVSEGDLGISRRSGENARKLSTFLCYGEGCRVSFDV